MDIQLKKSLQTQIFQQMEACYPNEGGGFLLGKTENASVQVEEITQIENEFAQEEQYHRYAMSPRDWMRLEDLAETRNLTLVGYYHSHPDSPAVPSEYDREHALPNFIYLITSVQKGHAIDMRVWQLRPDRSQFIAEKLAIHPDQ